MGSGKETSGRSFGGRKLESDKNPMALSSVFISLAWLGLPMLGEDDTGPLPGRGEIWVLLRQSQKLHHFWFPSLQGKILCSPTWFPRENATFLSLRPDTDV